jgi:hypothetical protein
MTSLSLSLSDLIYHSHFCTPVKLHHHMYTRTPVLLLLAAAAAAAAEPSPQAPASPVSCEALVPLAHELVQAFCFDAEPNAGGHSTPRQRELCDRARRQLGYTSGVEPSELAFLNVPAHSFFPASLSHHRHGIFCWRCLRLS